MKKVDILDILRKHGGYLINTHVVFTSGKHGDAYLNKDAIYPHTDDVSLICKEIAEEFKNGAIEAVAAPALGGIILSQWTAWHLSKLTGREVLGVYTEKTPEREQIFTRGYGALVKGKKVLVVEDITTTGGSARKVVNSVKLAGGKVLAVCVLVNREIDNVNASAVGAPLCSLAEVSMESWNENECPLCKEGVPINTTVGKGREYLVRKH